MPRRPQKDLRRLENELQEWPKTAPRAAKSVPRRPQEPPRAPQDGPKSRQEHPKSLQESSGKPFRMPVGAQRVPRGRRGVPRDLFLEPFWSPRGLNFELFGGFSHVEIIFFPASASSSPRGHYASKPPRLKYKGPAAWGRSPLDNIIL